MNHARIDRESTFFQLADYTTIRSTLEQNASLIFFEDQQEIILYDSLPFPTLPVNFTGVTNNVDTIILHKTLHRALLFPVTDPQETVGRIFINGTMENEFEYDPQSNGVAPGLFDFEGIVAHEICHMLGFLSTSAFRETKDDPFVLQDRVTLFDMFRIGENDLTNGAISSGPFASAARYLVGDSPPIPDDHFLCTRLSLPDWTVRLGRFHGGPNENTGHWRDSDQGDPIGLMAPNAPVNNTHAIRTPDVRAMDILGWNVSQTQWIPGGEAAPENPPQDTQSIGLQPIFQWTTDAFVNSARLVVWQNGERVLNVPDLTNEFYMTPPGVLDYETTYHWAILTSNSNGINQSETWSFTTEAEVIEPPACPADLNGDGDVDTADLGGLLGAFGNTGPPGTVFGDINEDGVVDTADVGILLGAFGPCPE